MTPRFIVPATVVAVLAATAAGAQTLRPFDEAARDPSFLAYRKALIAAVRRNDVDAIVSMAAPRIQVGYGAENGRKEFRRNLEGDPKVPGPRRAFLTRQYRRDLIRVLTLGGGFLTDRQGRVFVAPYLEAHGWRLAAAQRAGRKVNDPTKGWDAYQIAYIIRRNVPVYEFPNPHAKVLRRFSYNIVQLGPKSIQAKPPLGVLIPLWQQVRLPAGGPAGGAMGWIREGTFHQTVGYRAAFRKINGRWQMTRFLAGD